MHTLFKTGLKALACVATLLLHQASGHATETENLNIRILPAKQVTVDGDYSDWDLSGGIFTCRDVLNLREKMGVWIHTMYDKDNLYVLARWIDETPMSNPGLSGADSPWKGDSLQMRIILDPSKKVKFTKGKHTRDYPVLCWANGWVDRNGKTAMDIDFPRGGGEVLKEAMGKGVQQAFKKHANGKGYTQEIAMPWKLLAGHDFTPEVGKSMKFSVEPNFNTSANFRVSMKDIFEPGVIPDRVFTFQAYKCWGLGTFTGDNNVIPQKLRLADRREFDVTMKKGVPAINWTGLFEEKKREGFVKIKLNMLEDGFVSLNIKNAEGRVIRQLLTANFYTAGEHEILWDGLTNMSHFKPGSIVPAGSYTWEAIYHTGIGLRMVGWAHNGGSSPYNSPKGNWGGDHGNPSAVVTDGKQMYLGWSGSEAGKALVATNLDGKVKWRHKEGGFGGAKHLAVGKGVVYVNSPYSSILYRLTTKKGEYTYWKGKQTAIITIGPDLKGMTYADGKLYLSQGDAVRVLDAETGEQVTTISVTKPGDIEQARDGKIYVLSNAKQLLRIVDDKKTEVALDNLGSAHGLAISAKGEFYIGVREPDNQVKIYSAEGKVLRTIGKTGGRPQLGPWVKTGLRYIQGMVIDSEDKLWIAEYDDRPKRFSVWHSAEGKLLKEFFGPTPYGATGGAIAPHDPYMMVGSGAEWQLNKETGRAECVGVFHLGEMGNTRFGQNEKGDIYVATGPWRGGKSDPVHIYQRVGKGQWKLRTIIHRILSEKKNKRNRYDLLGIRVWADQNDDQKEQANEVTESRGDMSRWINGWYMPMTQSMTFYGGLCQLAPVGYTACGAPQYDLTKATKLPAPKDVVRRGGMGAQHSSGSHDDSLVIYNGHYGKAHSDFVCYDIKTGKVKWTYPNNYVGVHGGHDAPPKQVGMIRGAYDIVGSGKMPGPVGNFFLIGTDKGEWHIMTGEGFYVTSLFESRALYRKLPGGFEPGAILDTVPPGIGAEDFGGSMIMTKDGDFHIQAGKTAYINIKVVGMDSIKTLGQGSISVAPTDLAKAKKIRENLLQDSVGTRYYSVAKKTPDFSGNLGKDFAGGKTVAFQLSKGAEVKAAASYDDGYLHVGWTVNDRTPWVNGASDAAFMYARGDTVDLQLGVDPTADAKRKKAILGDMRISIGNLKGKPTAVVYRRISKHKQPRKFFSGVVRDGYEMQEVSVIKDARIQVKIDAGNGRYHVQAAIPLAAIGLTPKVGLKIGADFGATHGDETGKDTVLRTHWNNQKTGIVADEVFELQMHPDKWGVFTF